MDEEISSSFLVKKKKKIMDEEISISYNKLLNSSSFSMITVIKLIWYIQKPVNFKDFMQLLCPSMWDLYSVDSLTHVPTCFYSKIRTEKLYPLY